MASNSRNSTVNLASFLLLLLLLSLANTVRAVPAQELESMLAAMRARGYNLFANAITTSDIQYEVISGNAFTFFAPINSSLFALDMTSTASDYVITLRCHVVPRRLSMSELRRFPSGHSVPTLLPGRNAVIDHSPSSNTIAVDGVRIAVPGLFYGRDIAVHGLGGIISIRYPVTSRQRPSPMSHPLSDVTGNNSTRTHAPPPTANPQGNRQNDNHTVASSNSRPPSNFTSNRTFGKAPSRPVAFHGTDEINNRTVVPDGTNDQKGLSPAILPVIPPQISAAPEPASAPSGATHPIPSEVSSVLLSEFSSQYKEPPLAGHFFYSSQEMIDTHEDYRPLDENTFNCPLTDDKPGSIDHSKVNHGYFYTREHYSIPTMTCAQTH